jgi:hypothetical protein
VVEGRVLFLGTRESPGGKQSAVGEMDRGGGGIVVLEVSLLLSTSSGTP